MPLIFLLKKKKRNSCLIPIFSFPFDLDTIILTINWKKYWSRSFPWKKDTFFLTWFFFFSQEKRCNFPGKTNTGTNKLSHRIVHIFPSIGTELFPQKNILHPLGIFTISELTEWDIFQWLLFSLPCRENSTKFSNSFHADQRTVTRWQQIPTSTSLVWISAGESKLKGCYQSPGTLYLCTHRRAVGRVQATMLCRKEFQRIETL